MRLASSALSAMSLRLDLVCRTTNADCCVVSVLVRLLVPSASASSAAASRSAFSCARLATAAPSSARLADAASSSAAAAMSIPNQLASQSHAASPCARPDCIASGVGLVRAESKAGVFFLNESTT